ncbi:hypothetical protein BV25DRAFT_1828181 [Artomyces pyxidatus]|uniref:Uncharacterized protein n=1 Tax=Artomyces pyxidatus TaxID=48021 RepID=A0ACB8SW03_9AGAM|nr:hypothetical protein BV25DRAFT_1828181 [Artomyces pyxidatus]
MKAFSLLLTFVFASMAYAAPWAPALDAGFPELARGSPDWKKRAPRIDGSPDWKKRVPQANGSPDWEKRVPEEAMAFGALV